MQYKNMNIEQLKKELVFIDSEEKKIRDTVSTSEENSTPQEIKKEHAKINVRQNYQTQLSELRERRRSVNKRINKLMVS